jgi:hypothetical protein
MPEWVRAWWVGLTPAMRWFVMVVVVIFAAFVMWSFAMMGTDYSGVGEWMRSWFS